MKRTQANARRHALICNFCQMPALGWKSCQKYCSAECRIKAARLHIEETKEKRRQASRKRPVILLPLTPTVNEDGSLSIPIHNFQREVVAYAVIDIGDGDVICSHKWFLSESRGHRYTATSIRGIRIWMHRLLMGLTANDTALVDHINHDGLDNRRSNLRIVTNAENLQNRALPPSHNTSGYRGVSYSRFAKRWAAHANLNGKKRHLGYFATPEEAHVVVSTWRREHMPYSAQDKAVV